jgi:hypothetical protein
LCIETVKSDGFPMNELLERLLWQRADGELSAQDRDRLEALLAEEPAARATERELAEVADLLARVEEQEAPTELRWRVMSSIGTASAPAPRVSWGARALEASRRALVTMLFETGFLMRKENPMARKKLVLLGAMVVLIVGAVVALVLTDVIPPQEGLTGAIGGVEKADRYRDNQVTADDVRVYDAEGYDQDGYDKDGFDRSGLDRDGRSKADLGKGDLGKGDFGKGDLGKGLFVGDQGKGDLGKGDMDAFDRGDLGKGDMNAFDRGDLGKGDMNAFDRGDLGKGDMNAVDRGDLGKGDLGKGDLGKGDMNAVDRGDLGKGDLGKGDLGKGDLGKGDLSGNNQ